MNKGIIIAFIIIVLGGIALIDAGTRRPINWTPTFDQRDKVPFGLYVLHQELSSIFGAERKINDTEDATYEEIERLDSLKAYNTALIDILDYGTYGDTKMEPLLKFVHGGGEAFISTLYVDEWLLDTLGVAQEELRYSIFFPSDKNVMYSLAGDTARIRLEKVTDFTVFTKLNSKNCTILGNLHARGRVMPNFIKVSFGKGYFFLHTSPSVFTNYNMLTESGYHYSSKALQVVTHKNIRWIDNYYDSSVSRSPLRVVLSQSGFRQAWYLLLVGLLLLLIFKSKREQRAVKIFRPEPNLSRDFAKTIGTLYYENGKPGNIVLKKIDYFLYAIRNSYQLETLELMNPEFIRQLSRKSGVEIAETQSLLTHIDQYRRRETFTVEDVKLINYIIENFKSKANII
ncbi:DUF4350 domain-containing protein [Sphingobacterium pedocola]|uniref:DUF4350 domain-containing protein n=1 Tax=Sphingobacterium pedocola TaxID=2082722 RepID=A0ABR9TE47_9SPHI|nr:DUF4350 domain-containing protein [Sphingobacterium pedocola]MBE8722917.1 DUF4350 domain-containing protein [Sphingobacterium pedocola]